MAYSVKQCEKIDLNSHDYTWKALPDMVEARCTFNPCLFNELVYLCGYHAVQMEAFSPPTDTFLSLQLQLPENSSTCLYVYNSILVLHTNNYVTKYSAGRAGQLLLHSQVRSPARVPKHSNSHPVLMPSLCLFFLSKGDKCHGYRMETGALVP